MLQEEAAELARPGFVDDLRRIEQAGRRLLELIEAGQGPAPAVERAAPGAAGRREPRLRGTGARSGTDFAGSSGAILVVDDNEMNRDMLSRRLARQGYNVVTAAGGGEALARVDAGGIDLVLLDVMMPDVGGLEVLATLRRSHDSTELPVIMATAKDASEDVVAAFEVGANDYVTKPIDFPVVLARVRSQLSLKHARDQIKELNRRLAEAQDRIGQLAESSGAALENVESWASQALVEVADAVGARAIDLWLVADGDPASRTASGAAAPSTHDLEALRRTGKPLRRETDLLVPVIGLSGELFGALIVDRGQETTLGESGEGLIGGFARHLASTLELKKMRQDLAAAAERRRATRQELLEQGIDVLQICPRCGRCYDQSPQTCADDGETLESPRLLPYRIAGRYRLLRRAGEGAMGTVFQALDQRLERAVAVKIIRPELFDQDILRLRFEREARSVARIDHPGVVSVFDSGEIDGGSLYIVMEWLEGLDLRAVLDAQGPGAASQVAQLLRQAGAALDAAHRAKLLHRDIKPENLFLGPEGSGFRVKILDFGVAKQLAADVSLTQTGGIIGTPVYMAPEQLAGSDVDERTDLYSLAAVAFQALTGRRTVQSENLSGLLFEVRDRPAPLVSSLVPAASQEVDEIFARALERTPERRPRDLLQWAEEAAAALERLADGGGGWEIRISDDPSVRQTPATSAPGSGEEATRMFGEAAIDDKRRKG